jgi:hypothetical protein
VPITVGGVPGEYRAPTIANSDLPALLGLESLTTMRSIIDVSARVMYVPGHLPVVITPAADTKVIRLETAMSGHLLIPCDEWPRENTGRTPSTFAVQGDSALELSYRASMREERERRGANNTLSPERTPTPQLEVGPPTARTELTRERHRDVTYGQHTCPAPTRRDRELIDERNAERALAAAEAERAPDPFPDSLELYPRRLLIQNARMEIRYPGGLTGGETPLQDNYVTKISSEWTGGERPAEPPRPCGIGPGALQGRPRGSMEASSASSASASGPPAAP